MAIAARAQPRSSMIQDSVNNLEVVDILCRWRFEVVFSLSLSAISFGEEWSRSSARLVLPASCCWKLVLEVLTPLPTGFLVIGLEESMLEQRAVGFHESVLKVIDY
jgi:hypothetical protein